ncbi:hypothetical protein [Bdellovibrio bacteriovorus]|uniref:Uncharacterized protein n=1 Tax=Bdellovibrio bacteriovorus str. Tiberius TaxID=1069642 RepID=K7ZBN7_BDEBC|nr:hypothetical protein [Bdellovibrio bacteriovorus]AFY02484.1 hypothetical protein Bdt_2803 [Bdellovibrio bacteriovorus str. Tiberius]
MKAIVFAFAALFVSVVAQADVLPAVVAKCSGHLNDDTAVSFVIQDTAVVNLKQGMLATFDGDFAVNMICKKADRPEQNIPDRSPAYSCVENRAGDGKYIINLVYGISGRLVGQIQQEQIFPLKPQTIGSIFCR